jgi:hypothetical protein
VRLHKKHTENPFQEGELNIKMEEAYIIKGLSKTAMKLYMFLREHAFRTNGRVIFDFAMAKGICNFKQDKSVYNALGELINNDIIAGSDDSIEYYYNPNFMSNQKE